MLFQGQSSTQNISFKSRNLRETSWSSKRKGKLRRNKNESSSIHLDDVSSKQRKTEEIYWHI